MALLRFLRKNRFLVAPNSGGELTHTLMDGGNVSLPDSATAGFMAAYGEDLLHGNTLCVVERRTPVFKMHFDLDLKGLHSQDSCLGLVQTIWKAVSACAPSAPEKTLRMVVCAPFSQGGARSSPGLHLIFPWLQVHSGIALRLRDRVLAALQRDSPLEEDWSSVVDKCVLTSNGFRMVGSHKCKVCPSCCNLSQNRPFCSTCTRTGKLFEDHVYWPWLVVPVSEKHLLRSLQQNAAFATHICSTRVPSGMQRVCPELGSPEPANLSSPKARSGTQAVTLDTALAESLLTNLGLHHPVYNDVLVTGVESIGSEFDPALLVKVRGPGSCFCQNKGGEHASSTVFFVVSDRGVAQKCNSRKSTRYGGGFCEGYLSAWTAAVGPVLERVRRKRKICEADLAALR